MPQKNFIIRKYFLFLLIVVSAIHAHSQTAEEIISKYITFSGGKQRWKKINTIVTSGIYNYGGMEFPFTTFSKAPNLYKFIVPFNGKYYAQAFNGEAGWKIDAFKNQTERTLIGGKPALAMANEADVELESALIDYKKKGHTISLQGKDTVNSKPCFIIKLIKKSGDVETYFFNTTNFSIVKKTAVSKNEEMENKLLDTFYNDYREVNGLKIPFSAVSKTANQTILSIIINKIEFNVTIDDKEFQ